MKVCSGLCFHGEVKLVGEDGDPELSIPAIIQPVPKRCGVSPRRRFPAIAESREVGP